jgi:trimethylamine--corrinoid protein Co-methyltransferase
MKLSLTLDADNDLIRIHESAMKILNKTGCRFQSEKARQILKKHGAKIEGETVFLPPKLIENSIEMVPSSFRWKARNDTFSTTIGDKKIKLGPNAGNIYVQDLDKGRRLAKLADVRRIQKIHQASECTDFVGNNPCEPSDIDNDKRHLYVTYEVLKHTNKPIVSYFAPYKNQSEEILHMVVLAFGEKDILSRHHVVGTSLSSNSPLVFTQETLDVMFTFSSHNQPVMITTAPMGGITGPLNLMGIALQQLAELMAGTTLVQLINPGNPVVWGPSSTIAWLKDATYSTGTPEAMLPNMLVLQMTRDFYNIPTRSMGGLTDSKVVDSQAGYETMQNIMLAILGGAEIVYEALGVLDNIMTTSYEKIIIDEEMFQRVSRINRGIDSSAIEESLALIQEVGCGGDFLTQSYTLQHFRDMWKPTVSCWDDYSEWENAGSHDAAERANKIWKARLDEAPASLIDTAAEKDLLRFIELPQ